MAAGGAEAAEARANWWESSEIVDGAEWVYSIDASGFARVHRADSNALVGAVSVPATLGGAPVGTIDASSFHHCDKMTSVEFPETVTNMESSVFSFCSSLTEFTIPASVRAFGCDQFSKCSSLREVRVEEGNEWFTMRDGMLFSKDFGTLLYCPTWLELECYEMPATLTNILRFSFRDCEEVTSLSIPGSLKQIAGCAFMYCRGLKSVTLGEGVERIGNLAFAATSLTTILLPATVQYVAWDALPGTLEEIRVAAGNSEYEARDGVLFSKDGTTLVTCPAQKAGDYTVPAGVRHLADGAFGESPQLHLTIPEGVESTGYRTFGGWAWPTIVLPHSLKSLGTYAFQSSTALEEIELPEGLESIGEGAFYFCKGLRRLIVPDSVKYVGTRVLTDCFALRYLELPGAWDGQGILDGPWGCVVAYRAKGRDGATWRYRVEGESAVLLSVEGVPESGALEVPTSLNWREVSGLESNALAGVEGLARLGVPASWEGSATLAAAGVPEGCEVEYVAAAAQTLEWAATGDGFAAGDRVQLSATASGGDPVQFRLLSGPAVLEGTVLTFTNSGTVRVRAREPGSIHWEAVEETREMVAEATVGGRRVKADLAANYDGGWTNGGTGGEGFGAWRIETTAGSGSGWAGSGIWDPSANRFKGTWAAKTRAFGLVGKGEGWGVRASRSFERALLPGDAFSLEMALYWDSNREGATKGFALTAGGADVVVVNHESYPGNISLNGETNHAALNAYGRHPMVWTFTAVDAKTLRVEATPRDGSGGCFTGLLDVATSAIDGFRLQSAGQNPGDSGADGDKRQSYFDDFRLFYAERTASGVPHAWLAANAGAILEENGWDWEAAANAEAANGRRVWECYAGGLDPSDEKDELRAELVREAGSWKVRPVGGGKKGRVYRVEGKKELGDKSEENWTTLWDGFEYAWEAEGWRFFRLRVEVAE